MREVLTPDFRVHKYALSLVSPLFKELSVSPQTPIGTPDIPPHIDFTKSLQVWEKIFRTICPMPNPTIYDPEDPDSLLFVAQGYQMRSTIDVHKKSLRVGCLYKKPFTSLCHCVHIEEPTQEVIERDENSGQLKMQGFW